MQRTGEFGAGPFSSFPWKDREFEVSSTVAPGRRIDSRGDEGRHKHVLGSVFTYYRGSSISARRTIRIAHANSANSMRFSGAHRQADCSDKAHLFSRVRPAGLREPVFTGLVQSADDEITNGIARDRWRDWSPFREHRTASTQRDRQLAT